MEVHVRVIGFILIGLSLIHIIFPKYFNWKEDLAKLTLINREMMIIHTFFIAFVVFLMGVLCISAYQDLINTELGNIICLGMGLFWLVRLLIQLFGYSTELWKGKKLETIVHIVFSGFWLYFTVVFISVYFN